LSAGQGVIIGAVVEVAVRGLSTPDREQPFPVGGAEVAPDGGQCGQGLLLVPFVFLRVRDDGCHGVAEPGALSRLQGTGKASVLLTTLIRETLRPEDDVVVGADPNPGGHPPLRQAQRPEQVAGQC
jgi:hypothetical protein